MPYDHDLEDDDEFILDRLAEARADQDLDTPGPGPLPDSAPTTMVRRTGSAVAAERKRGDAERKRRQRIKRRGEGLLEGPVVDAVIITAVASHLARMGVKNTVALRGAIAGLRVPLLPILGEAKALLIERGATPKSAARMLGARLLGVPLT